MRDFDIARNERLTRERSFRLGGETFTYKPSVKPEELLAWDQRHDKVGEEFLSVVDETVVAFLDPGQEDKWRHVRAASTENPVNIQDIVDLIAWLFEEQVGRPTGPVSASTNGHESGATPTTLMGGSFSPATPAA